MPATGPPQLSVLIPAYNEALRLPATLERVAAFLSARILPQRAEILVVDDGSRDATAPPGRGVRGPRRG